jgi:hypothetical protein
MLRIPLVDEYALLLSPRWGDLGPAAQAGLLALLGLAPLLLVLWLYRYEMRLIRRLTALALLTLRLVVIGLLWLLIALQPVVARSTSEELPGRVLIAVDRSASTDVTDPQRPTLDKLRLARALRLRTAAGLPTEAQLDIWISHYEQQGPATPPPWVADGGAPDDAARRQLAEERRAAHDELCALVDRLTRGEVARRLLASDGLGLLPTLTAKHKVELIGFHRQAWDVPADRLEDLFRAGQDAKAEKSSAVPPAGASFTDLRQPLAQALERAGPDRGRVLGVVLLTDGQHNWGPSPVTTAEGLHKSKVPVFPVALGAREPPPDIAVSEVKAPANVFKGVDANVEARFKVSGLPAQDLKVELHVSGKPPLKEHVKTVHHDGTDRFYTVRFQARMDEPGTQSVEVRVRPADERTREVTKENNSRAAVVRVAGERARVLLIDGEARWEYHYLANALRRDRTMEPESVVFLQPRLGQVPEAQLEQIGNPRLRLPEKKDTDRDDPLAKYDCIILGDVAPAQLPPAERRRLELYVADRGGTLVLLAGKRYMPLRFAGPEAGEADPLLKMLPVERPRVANPVAGFPVTLTHEGGVTPFLQMDPSPEGSARRWAELPRHYWGVIGKAKPGAESLAFVAGSQFREPGAEPGKAAKETPERTQSLIALQNYGFGRVVFVGLDSTWRWRYKVGDLYHHRFWGQLIRWAASDKLLPAGNKYVRFGSRDPVYRQGREVDVVARLEDEAGPLPPRAQASARVLRQGAGGKEEPVAVIKLTPSPAQPRLLQGQVLDLPEGRYRVELDIPSLSDKVKAPSEEEGEGQARRDTFTVLPSDSGEMFQLATNWPLLESLAARTGGEVVTPEDAGRLPELLTRQVVRRELHDEQKLWQDMPLVWYVLGLFLLLLTLEWAGRKLAGLP